MSKHTKGPWHTCKAFNSGQLHVMADGPHGLQRAIALDVWADNEENAANARLIAAAPELLYALQVAITSMLDAGHSPNSATMKLAKAAVAKATA